MTEINENYASEYTPHAPGRHSFQPNSSLQEHSARDEHNNSRSRRESTPLELHTNSGARAMNSMRGGRDESPPLSKDHHQTAIR